MNLQKPVISILTHILDDDSEFMLLLAALLKNYPDIECKFYSNVKEFLDAIELDKRICIIDYNLKEDLNGLDILKIIMKKNPLSYVIMVSGQSDLEVVTEFYDGDGFRYISKSHCDFSTKLINSIYKAKEKIQRNLDFNFDIIEKFNKTQETIKNARDAINGDSLGNNS